MAYGNALLTCDDMAARTWERWKQMKGLFTGSCVCVASSFVAHLRELEREGKMERKMNGGGWLGEIIRKLFAHAPRTE